MEKNNEGIIPEEMIQSKIYLIRGQKVMLDSDLALLYGVSTRNLNKAVKRNIQRFPDDFMFRLSKEEYVNLMFQIGTSSWGGTRKLPFAFTEHGVAMLSGVLRSDRAILVNLQIIRVFTRMRQLIESQKEILRKLEELQKKDIEQDDQIRLIFEYLQALQQAKTEEITLTERKRIGFKRENEV